MRTELCLVRATDSSQGRWCWEVQEGVSEEINDRAPASEGGAEVSWVQSPREGLRSILYDCGKDELILSGAKCNC